MFGAAYAQKDQLLAVVKSADKPIEITATKFSVKKLPEGTEGTFEGSVKVQQGDLTMTCDRLVIVYDQKNGNGAKTTNGRLKNLPKELQSASQIRSITASGNVKLAQNDRIATAEKALFDSAKRTITLTGGPPRLWQGKDMILAEKIIIYLDEQRSEWLSPQGTGIKAVIHPENHKDRSEK